MKASEAIRQAIDNGSEINAEGAYLIALAVEQASEQVSN